MYLIEDKNINFVFDLFNFYSSNIEKNLNEISLVFIIIFFIFIFKDLVKYTKKFFNKEKFIFLLFLFQQISNVYILISNENKFQIILNIQLLLFIQILKKYLFKFEFLKEILIFVNFFLTIVFYYNNNNKNIKNYCFIYSIFINFCFIFNLCYFRFNIQKQIKKKKNIILLILLNINILFYFYYYYYNFLIEILFKKTNQKIQNFSLLFNYFLLFIYLCNLIINFFHMKNNNNNNNNKNLNKKIKINFSTKKIKKLKYNLKRKLINHKLNINYLKTIKYKEKNIENLIKENNKLSKENKILKNKLNSFINENNKNYFNINDLNRQIKKLKTTISNNENDINYLYDELDNKDLEIKEYLKEKNNLLFEINEKENSIKILNEKINENNKNITPEKYEIVKVVNYLNKFTFYLFKYKHKGSININDFKWKFKENENDFNNFKIPKDNSFNYQKEIDNLNNKLLKKEDEYNKLNLNFAKLFNQKNIENKNLKFKINNISKYNFYNNNNIITNNINNNNNSKNNSKKNIIDVSNIETFSDESNFVDNSEVDELINYNNNNNNKINNNNLSKIKEIVDNFIIQYGNNLFKLNLKLHFANLFKLLNLNEEEIYKILGKYRTKNINISIK